jgi:hypothetical protein
MLHTIKLMTLKKKSIHCCSLKLRILHAENKNLDVKLNNFRQKVKKKINVNNNNSFFFFKFCVALP